MRGDLILPLATLWGFLLTLARVSGAFVFVPIPGMRGGLEMGRAVLAIAVTVALFPQWPRLEQASVSPGQMAVWLAAEAGLGIAVGLAVTLLMESFTLAAQLIGLQAGYAYASTVDPATQADSSILLVLAQLTAGLLFFALGFDREVMRIFASSLTAHPPGSFALSRPAAEAILRLGAGMFSTALRLAMPILALMVLVDIALALLGRINTHLQLLTVAFPAKMLVTLGLLAWMTSLFPAVFRGFGNQVFGTVRGALLGQ
ncbi:MAG: type secretion system inner rane protein [Proteobacteria bacterium]|nr:type secretion system inner rane protein [Pseudomonadota bacterium]